MIVLRAIGAFFARIWRWIRETAWVQPLLIVGLIFGVMFSIKPIYNAIKNAKAKADSAETYYRQFQVSLEGKEESQAYKLTRQLEKSMLSGKNEIDKSFNLGDKFFLVYVAETCDKCNAAKGGFEYLEDHFDSINIRGDKSPFNMVTIFTDEVMSDGSDSEQTAFISYLDANVTFFNAVGGAVEGTPCIENDVISEDDLGAIANADPEYMWTPTIFLVDFTDSRAEDNGGVTDVFVGVEESGTSSNSDANKAQFLYECWTHQGKFERK